MGFYGGGAPTGVFGQVGRSSLLVGTLKKKYAQELLAEKLPPQDNATTTDSEMEEPYLQGSTRPPRNDSSPPPPPSERRFGAELVGCFSLWASPRAPQNPKRRGTPPN